MEAVAIAAFDLLHRRGAGLNADLVARRVDAEGGARPSLEGGEVGLTVAQPHGDHPADAVTAEVTGRGAVAVVERRRGEDHPLRRLDLVGQGVTNTDDEQLDRRPRRSPRALDPVESEEVT